MANNTVKLAVEEATKKTTAGDGRIVRIIGPVVFLVASSTASFTVLLAITVPPMLRLRRRSR